MHSAPPRIRLPRQYEDGLLFEQDETIRLKVSLAGRPSPVVTWYHDGEPISKDARHVFEAMDGESVLKIPDAKRNDRGEYSVKAANKLGEDAASFLVTVTGRSVVLPRAFSLKFTILILLFIKVLSRVTDRILFYRQIDPPLLARWQSR